MRWRLLGTLAFLTFTPIYFISLMWTFSPISPLSYYLLFDVAHTTSTDFNFTATTNYDGTNNFHYRYNVSLNIKVRKLDNNYHFLHYDDVKVMAYYKYKRFAMVDLSSFYRGKELANTTDLLSMTHSLIAEHNVLVTDPPPVDSLNVSEGHDGGAAAITNDYIEAHLYYSISPPRNVNEWMYTTIYSNEELEFRCELELEFPLVQNTNVSSLKTIKCKANVLAHNWKYYLYVVFVVPFFILISLTVFACIMWICGDQPAYAPCKFHD